MHTLLMFTHDRNYVRNKESSYLLFKIDYG